ncbi:unnamed protein product, partial [Effrenium voratum]
MTALNSDVLVSSSTAGRSGGAAYVDGTMTMAQSRVDIFNCSAGDTGGGLCMSDLIGDAVNMSNCSAAAMGGCIRVKQSLKLDEAVLAGCAASAGNAVASTGDVHIGNLSLLGGETEQSGNYFSVGGSLRLGTMTCDDTPECEVSSQEDVPQVASVARCPLGAGRDKKSSSVGCTRCRPGTMLLQPKPDAACIPCPELAEECRPSHVKLQQGITVNTTDFSQVLHCPNPAACPEHVITAPVPLDPPSYSLYCQKGYEGPACSSCSSGYGRSDGSVLVCVKCSESTQQLVRHAAQYALKDVALFAVAAHGVLGAKAEKKNSAVYLNQLLAFATVSSAALTGVMQTSAVASLRDWTTNLLKSIEIFSDFLQGQSGATMSMECLLAFAGESLVFAHAAASLMPILLVLTLAMIKDPRVSLVVGTNVFLPGFTSKFGKYLVAYRLQPQDQGGDLLTPFLPGVPGAFWWVLACITACFVLGAWSWTRMALSTEKPSPPHVLYLTQAYKPSFEAWEVERLVRKMMLTVVSTVLPVTLSPALQMQCISAILLGSLMLYAHVRPYKEDDWNRLELRLLGCAVLITGFTTCLLANDSHWSRSLASQPSIGTEEIHKGHGCDREIGSSSLTALRMSENQSDTNLSSQPLSRRIRRLMPRQPAFTARWARSLAWQWPALGEARQAATGEAGSGWARCAAPDASKDSGTGKALISRLLREFREQAQPRLLIPATVISMSLAGVASFRACLTGRLLDIALGIAQTGTGDAARALAPLAGLYLAAALYGYIANVFQSILFALARWKMSMLMRQNLFKALMRQEVAFFEQNSSGALVSRLTNDTDQLQNVLNRAPETLVTNLMRLTVSLVLMAQQHKLLTMASVAHMPLAFLLVKKTGQVVGRYGLLQNDALARVNGVASEAIANVRAVQLAGAESTETKEYDSATQNYLEVIQQTVYKETALRFLSTLLNDALADVPLLCLSCWFIAKGELTMGQFYAYRTLLWSYRRGFRELADLFTGISRAQAVSRRYFDLKDREPRVRSEANALPLPKSAVEGHLKLDGVSFHYADQDSWELQDVSFCVEPGEVVALVGASGAGKSTVLKLCARLADPQEGSVQLDGKDLRELNLQ